MVVISPAGYTEKDVNDSEWIGPFQHNGKAQIVGMARTEKHDNYPAMQKNQSAALQYKNLS